MRVSYNLDSQFRWEFLESWESGSWNLSILLVKLDFFVAKNSILVAESRIFGDEITILKEYVGCLRKTRR